MSRKSYVRQQEDYITRTHLYGMFFTHLRKQSGLNGFV